MGRGSAQASFTTGLHGDRALITAASNQTDPLLRDRKRTYMFNSIIHASGSLMQFSLQKDIITRQCRDQALLTRKPLTFHFSLLGLQLFPRRPPSHSYKKKVADATKDFSGR